MCEFLRLPQEPSAICLGHFRSELLKQSGPCRFFDFQPVHLLATLPVATRQPLSDATFRLCMKSHKWRFPRCKLPPVPLIETWIFRTVVFLRLRCPYWFLSSNLCPRWTWQSAPHFTALTSAIATCWVAHVMGRASKRICRPTYLGALSNCLKSPFM